MKYEYGCETCGWDETVSRPTLTADGAYCPCCNREVWRELRRPADADSGD